MFSLSAAVGGDDRGILLGGYPDDGFLPGGGISVVPDVAPIVEAARFEAGNEGANLSNLAHLIDVVAGGAGCHAGDCHPRCQGGTADCPPA